MQTTPPPLVRQPPFSAIVMDHFLHPRGLDVLTDPSGEGWSGSVPQSRYMRIQVQVADGIITAATFGTYGCAPAIAAGSFVCEWVAGKTVAAAEALTADQLTTMLGGLPAARAFCADLAVDALHAALMAVAPAATPPATQSGPASPPPASPPSPPAPPTSSG